MKKINFNENWSYAKQSSEFLGTPVTPFQPVTLPHDALIHETRVRDLPGERNTGSYPYGSYEYKKEFEILPKWKGRKLTLLFEGVYAASQVYVNHMLAGSCMNGYIPFLIELNPYLKEGKNEITVVCRCFRDSRWYSGAGIYRNVYLMVSDHLHMPYGKSRVVTKEITDREAVLMADVTVRNESSGTACSNISLRVSDQSGTTVCHTSCAISLFPGEERVFHQRLIVENPKLWSVEDPNLYHFEASLKDADTEEFDFGIRTLSLSKNRGMVLNGTTVKLRGTCLHHDNGILGACAYEEAAYRRIRLLKEAGVNAIRISHHPAGPELLQACDHLGMLIMNEVADAWTINKNPYDMALFFEQEWETIVTRMVQTSQNHPSVILYSLGNEILECGNPKGAQIASKLSEKIRELDSYRFTTLSLNVLFCMMDQRPPQDQEKSEEVRESKDINEAMTREQHVFKSMITSKETGRLVEEAMSYVDVVGYNYGDSRYAIDKEDYPERILCGSETFSCDLSENWRKVLDNPNIIGDFNWTGWDYIGEVGLGKVEYSSDREKQPWWRLAFCGDYDLNGTRRAQSYYRETVWGLAGHPWILVQDPVHYGQTPEQTPWSFFDGLASYDFPGCEGMPAEVRVYSDAQEVELFLNGTSLGRKPAGEAADFTAVYTVSYQPGTLRVKAYKEGTPCESWQLKSGEGKTALSVFREPEENRLFCGKTPQVQYYRIRNEYENGEVDIHTPVRIRIDVDNGELLGFGSADPTAQEPYDSSQCTLYNGEALAAVRGDDSVKVTVHTLS